MVDNIFLKRILETGISENSGLDYDEYIDLHDDIITFINEKNPTNLVTLLNLIDSDISSHIHTLLEELCDTFTIDSLTSIFKTYLLTSNIYQTRTILNLIELNSHESFIDILNNSLFLEHTLINHFSSVLLSLSKEFNSDKAISFLTLAYEKDLHLRIKFDIREYFINYHNITLEKYEGFIDYHLQSELARMDQLVKNSATNFKRKRYKTIIKELESVDANILNAMGKKYLKMAKIKQTIK